MVIAMRLVPPGASETVTGLIAETIFENIRVTFGPGIEVVDVVTGFEGTCVAIGNLPSCCTDGMLRMIVEPYGDLVCINLNKEESLSADALTITARVFYAKAEDAALAAKVLHGATEFFCTLTAKVEHFEAASGVGRFTSGYVKIDIPAPGLIAYAGYETEEKAQTIMQSVNGRKIGGNFVSVSMHHGIPRIGQFMLKFDGLSAETAEVDVKKFGVVQGIMFTQPRYKSLPKAIEEVIFQLKLCGEIFSFEVISDIPKDGYIQVGCQFFTVDAAEHALDFLNNKTLPYLGQGKLLVRHVRLLTYSLEKKVHLAIQGELEELTRYAYMCHKVQILVHDKHTYIRVELISDDSHELGKIKKIFEKIRAGEKLLENGTRIWHEYFSTSAGFGFLNNLGKAHEVYVRADERRGFLSFFGAAQNREEVRKLVLQKLYALRGKYTYSLPISPSFILHLAIGLPSKLLELLGRENIKIDLDRSRLLVHGTSEAFEQATTIVAQGLAEVDSGSDVVKGSSGDNGCPICLSQPSSPEKLHCGHRFCKECVTRYLKNATQFSNFPLRCLGKEATCKDFIPMALAKRLLSHADYEKLTEAAFRSFLYSRPKEFTYCPTPGCDQIHYMSMIRNFQCPSCLVNICPSCHQEVHDGKECTGCEDEDRQLFQKWMSENDVKPCPRCKTNIEKISGCNHMKCSQCQAHICWVCMSIFENGEGIYPHMRIIHGGIGM